MADDPRTSGPPTSPDEVAPTKRAFYDPRGWRWWPVNWPAVSALALVGGLILAYFEFDDLWHIAGLILEGNTKVEASVSDMRKEVQAVQQEVSGLTQDVQDIKQSVETLAEHEHTPVWAPPPYRDYTIRVSGP